MNPELRNLDTIAFNSRSSVNFACEYSEDDRVFIISATGIYIFALKGDLTTSFPTFSCKNDFFKASNFIPSANIDIDINSFHKDLERNGLYESTMSIEYSANLHNAPPIKAVPVAAQWSPRGIIGKTDCLLSVLTNLYGLELYVKYINENQIVEYCSICNITQEVINQMKSQWKYPDRLPPPLKLNELKKRVHSVSCTAFTWSHLYEIGDEQCCAIFVGHLNGDITVWRLDGRSPNSKEQSKLQFLGRHSTQLQKIIRMHWHCTTKCGGGLSFADSEGKMSVLHIKDLDQEVASVDNELAFWTEPDKVAVDKITVMTYENDTYIILIKQRLLIIYGLQESGEVFDKKVCTVGAYYVSGILHYDNVLLVLTSSDGLEQYKVSKCSGTIRLEKSTVDWNTGARKNRAHGLFCTKNMVMFGIVTYCSKLSGFSKKALLELHIFHNSTLDPLNILWDNPSGSLRDYWDCLEMLRMLCLKDKRFPWQGLPPDLNHDTLSLLQLKTLRWIAKISEVVFSSVPIIKMYDIKPYIILHYLVQIKLIVRRLSKLLTLRNGGRELSVFQMRSIDIQNFFLKEMVVKNVLAKANVGQSFIWEITQVIRQANELRYPPMPQCIWCGENIIGTMCLPPHADSRCSISMMPIFLAPAYKCPFCKSLAHKQIEEEEDSIFCGYCDIPMEKLYYDDKTDEIANEDYKTKGEEVKSVCFDDCLNEDVNFDDVEENECQYVIFSDSEDEPEEEHDKLRTLYRRLRGMSVEEIVTLDSAGVGDEQEGGPSNKLLNLTEEEG